MHFQCKRQPHQQQQQVDNYTAITTAQQISIRLKYWHGNANGIRGIDRNIRSGGGRGKKRKDDEAEDNITFYQLFIGHLLPGLASDADHLTVERITVLQKKQDSHIFFRN